MILEEHLYLCDHKPEHKLIPHRTGVFQEDLVFPCNPYLQFPLKQCTCTDPDGVVNQDCQYHYDRS